MKIIILVLVLFSSTAVYSSSDIAKAVFPSIVTIVAEDKHGQPLSLGSGFVIDKGIIATNFHVIEGAYSGYVKFINEKNTYKIRGVASYDINTDLALLKIDRLDAPILAMQKQSNLDIGDKIFAVGNPLGLEGTFSDGILSGIRKFEDFTVYQITAPISSGSSGGPVLNSTGQVIGVAASTLTEGQNINFAIPVKYLIELNNSKSEVFQLTSLAKNKISVIENKSIDFDVVKITHRRFVQCCNGDFSYSIKNNLEFPINQIRISFIIKDESGEPVDYNLVTLKDSTVSAKLASRYKIRLNRDALDAACGYYSYNYPNYEYPCNKSIEIRLLDFNIIN